MTAHECGFGPYDRPDPESPERICNRRKTWAMAAVRCGHDHLPVGNRQIHRETVMKIFPAVGLSGALLFAGVAACLSGYSAKSPTAASDANTPGIHPAIVVGTAGTELADPAQQGAAQCYSGGICDDYAIWMALHAAP
jgi:hypothetical protein